MKYLSEYRDEEKMQGYLSAIVSFITRTWKIMEICGGQTHTKEDNRCMSGLVLQDLKRPHACHEFGRRCRSEHPLGAPMVSSEGACTAYYRYRCVTQG